MAGVLSLVTLSSIHAQVENPANRIVQRIVASPSVQTVEADLVPLFWKASINDSIISIPLSKVEFFGVQDYIVDGATQVRELTISTQARSMIRIYHIRPLTAVDRGTNNLETLRAVAEGKTGGDENRPVKIFPTTTHASMVEYRVKEKKQIDELYSHLESTMVEYHSRNLVPEQRPETVREVTVKD